MQSGELAKPGWHPRDQFFMFFRRLVVRGWWGVLWEIVKRTAGETGRNKNKTKRLRYTSPPNKWSQCDPKVIPNWRQYDPKMMPKWSQNDAKMIPKWSQNDPRIILEWPWNDLGMILEWPPNEPRLIPEWPRNDHRMTPPPSCPNINSYNWQVITLSSQFMVDNDSS